ncbi:MAG TPA: ABC transporter substrate-binding protein [Burkholderiaceae bacterium]|nr:ABC transporter substrate-binding protein [Burkholderiaceae bacterium]
MKLLVTSLSLLLFLESSFAAEPIILGQSAALSGPASMLGTEMARGMNAYFNQVNEHGGIKGRAIKLITLDDGYEPDRTTKNTEKLIHDEKVVALVGFVGTPTSIAALNVAKGTTIPFIGAYTGADTLRDGKFDHVFNIRASYNDEALRIAKEIDGMGLYKMGIVYQNDAFGQAGLRAMQAAMAKHPNLKLAWTEAVERNSINVTAAAAKIASEHIDSVFVVSAYKTTGELLTKARSAGYVGMVSTLSFVGAEPLAQTAGAAAQGVLVSAVMPSPHSEPIVLSGEYRRLMAKSTSDPHYSYASMEGFVAAKVTVEALKKIDGNITPESIENAMRSLQLDLGGFQIDFSKGSNTSSHWVESTMIGAGGKITR